MDRVVTSSLASIALTGVLTVGGGCAPKMKPVEMVGQSVVRDGQAAMIEREGLVVIVTPVAIGLGDGHRLAGMRIDVLNQTNRTVSLDRRDVVLIGDDGLRRPTMEPGHFRRYAEMAQGDPPPTYRRAGPIVHVGVGYGGWPYYCGPHRYYGPPHYYHYDDYDATEAYYQRRERVARFVASLWRTRTVQPGYVAAGSIVFDYEIRKKEQVSVEVSLDRLATTRPASTRASATRAARPAPRPATRRLYDSPAGPLQLVFYFKT